MTAIGNGPSLRNGVIAFLGADATSVYTLTEGQGSASSQATIPSMYAAMNPYLALDPSGTTAYLFGQSTATPSQNYLLRCELGGAPCGYLTTWMGSTGVRLHANATYAFWGALFRYTFETTALDSFTTSVTSIGIDASNVYWSDGSTITSLPQSFASGATPSLVATSAVTIQALDQSIASDGTNVYYGTYNLNGSATLYYVPVGGGTSTALYTSAMNPASSEQGYLVTFGGVLYWADVNLGTSPPTSNIMGLATP